MHGASTRAWRFLFRGLYPVTRTPSPIMPAFALESTRVVILNAVVEPAFATSRCQHARPLLNVAPGAETKARPAGSVSHRSTCVASTFDGTRSVIVKTTVPPRFTAFGLADLVTTSLDCGGAVIV